MYKPIHVIPVNDWIEHDSSEGSQEDCICGPDPIHVEDGKWMYVHHSLDGREFEERKEPLPKEFVDYAGD